MIDGILQGLITASTPFNLMMVTLGCFIGTFIGMLPGLGPISAIALMLPITYGIDPASGLILMSGVYYGAVFGGSTSSILINAPGCSSTVVTAFDGYPMTCKGQSGKALALAAYASFTGGTLSAIMLLVAAPALATVSLSFQSSDYFALMLLGLSAVAAFAGKGQILKAWMMAIFGLMLSTVGIDKGIGVERFTFGVNDLMDGFSFLLLAMATFAMCETLISLMQSNHHTVQSDNDIQHITSTKVTSKEVREVAPVAVRSSLLGFVVGILPGAGATIAAFLSYGLERHLANEEQQKAFGKGSIRGLVAPEAANNAASTGSFVPLLTLGIPGSGTTAIMLGALIAYGIQPGPQMFHEHPEVFWSVIISMYLGNAILLVLNLPLIPYLARILMVPRTVLLPMILFFSMTGVYLVSFNTMDIYVMVAVSAIALALRMAHFPLAPMLLGFILGGLMEENLRRALMISDGDLNFLWSRPLTLCFTLGAVLIAISPIIKRIRSRQRTN